MGGWSRLVAGLAAICIIGACGPPQHPPQPLANSSPSLSGRPCTSVSLSADRTTPITAGQPVVLTAGARGCSKPKFRFVLADAAGAAGSVSQDWSTSSIWLWNTYGVSPGRYTIRADAKATDALDAPPDTSAYMAFVVTTGIAAAVPGCKLPVSGTLAGSGGFVQMPGGTFTADPSSNVPLRGQADMSGLRRGLTYDPVHGVWLPVPRDWVMPDFSSYVYVGTEYPHVSNMPGLHRVVLPAGTDAPWTNGDQLYGIPIALRPEGVYGAPGPEIITLVDPGGRSSTVDQGHYGLFAVITATAIWATSNANYSSLNDVQRIDPQTQATTDWFKVLGQTAFPIGVDGNGYPVIAVGKQLPSGLMAASQIWIVPRPASAAAPAANYLIYDDATQPLTILGWPVVSAGAIWIETDHGLWTGSQSGRIKLVSSHSGYIAGGCL